MMSSWLRSTLTHPLRVAWKHINLDYKIWNQCRGAAGQKRLSSRIHGKCLCSINTIATRFFS
jgi:hypothetical protein